MRKAFAAILWAAAVLLCGAIVGSALLPHRLGDDRQPFLAFAAIAFYVQSFLFHLGAVSALLTMVAIVLRRWRLAGVSALAAVVALLPTVPQFTSKRPRDGSDGWAVYSRVPFIGEVEPLKLYWSKRQTRFAIEVGGREVAVYMAHLTVPKSMEQIRRNRRETAHLIDLLAAETRPVVVAGDFNFTERSAQAGALRDAGLVSTHDLAGHGRGATWPDELVRKRIPGLRIDHIFVSGELTCTDATVLYGCGSDHRPIVADVGFAKR